jgi:hypothetical protein
MGIRHEGTLYLYSIYRCYVCRLELVVDPRTSQLIVAPLPAGRQPNMRAYPPEQFTDK